MKARDILAISILVVAAMLIVFRPWESGPSKEEKSSDTGAVGGNGGNQAVVSGAYGTGSERRTPSKRVVRDRPRKVTTESGLQYEVLTEGKGGHPGPTSTVKVHYVGTLEDGTVFDSSRDRGQAAEFPLNGVIKGWTEGLQLMKPGGTFRFTIPSDLAYGDRGAGETIPGGATLTFEVELLSIEKP